MRPLEMAAYIVPVVVCTALAVAIVVQVLSVDRSPGGEHRVSEGLRLVLFTGGPWHLRRELVQSSLPPRLGIPQLPNRHSIWTREEITPADVSPLASYIKTPVTRRSGYRTEVLGYVYVHDAWDGPMPTSV